MPEMISKKNINIIKNSASLITRNAPQITIRMYEILFTKYPHLKSYFSNAPQNQYMKLADALSAYAINIDKLHIFTPALMVIAQRHTETNIKSGLYPLVGEALITAIQDTLKSVDSDFIKAWTEAYSYLSGVLIEMETKIYEEQATKEELCIN